MNLKTAFVLLTAGALCSAHASAGDPAVAGAAPVTAPAVAAPAPPAAAIPLVTQDALLARQAKQDTSLFLLDVRSPEEFAQGHVPGAVNIPHDQVASRIAEVPKDKDVVLYCRSGRRTALAADVLSANGYTRLSHLEGDMNAWMEKGRPIQAKAPPEAIQH
jgi:rhodanese-related sulfurtransferase